ncbi:hypothetical protein AB205_0010930 [Aquarana catesbeiana]|uniref:HOOK N-terminal domain-containing protein n=1 Tax=Aquarana catesbeiana TaxID=8400 RepID=A0A2G9RD77_AQUCT|nr:hypothetical protein AB205_0010930 [Aquarana catesbeiana]
MQTFQVSGPCSSYEDLTGGVAIAQVLHVIDPTWFNETWMMRIKPDTGDNWRMKVLGHPVSEDRIPDVALIGEFSNTAELRKMVQLVLGCAISCDKKEGMVSPVSWLTIMLFDPRLNSCS